MIAPHGLHNHAENSARRTCRAQERSDLSQLVVCRPPQLVARPRPLYEHWRGPRSVGARYSLQKEKCSVLNNHRCLFFLIAGSIWGNRPIARRGEVHHGENDEDCGTGLTQTNKQNACQCHEALQEICIRQAAKADNDYKREEYLAAALSALVVTGVVASKLMANLEGKKAAAPGPARKKRKTKANSSARSGGCRRTASVAAISAPFSSLRRPLHIRPAQ